MTLHPDRYSTSGVTLRKLGVVVHDSESGDGSSAALLSALASPGDRPNSHGGVYGSGYHAVTDGTGGYTEVATAAMGPYAAPPTNKAWWHVCMPGRAVQTRTEWLDPLSRAHIRGAARFIVDKHAVDGFPLQRLSAAQLAAGDHGYCGHVDVTNAWHQTDHTDPGAGFPWDVLASDIAALLAPVEPPAVPPATEAHMKYRRVYVPDSSGREAFLALEMVGFDNAAQRDAVVDVFHDRGLTDLPVTAAVWDALVAVYSA